MFRTAKGVLKCQCGLTHYIGVNGMPEAYAGIPLIASTDETIMKLRVGLAEKTIDTFIKSSDQDLHFVKQQTILVLLLYYLMYLSVVHHAYRVSVAMVP